MDLPSVASRKILERLVQHPTLLANLKWIQLQRFIRITKRIWPEIINEHKNNLLPELLPKNISQFLVSVLQLDHGHVQLCWIAFHDIIERLELEINVADDDLFRLHGLENKIGAAAIHPPYKQCPRPECAKTVLGEPREYESRLYTLHRGVLPILSHSTYCRKCLTRYYHNYSVKNAAADNAQRIYYAEQSSILHVFEHSFVERGLCQFFEAQMALAHCSAQSIAKIYNMALSPPTTEIPNSSRLSHELSEVLVLDAFFLHALLRHKTTRQELLVLPHGGLQKFRFIQVMDERNLFMAGTGQEMWSHACDGCMKKWITPDGLIYYISAGVADGVTLGHPCCNVHDCKVRLNSTQDRFCPRHSHKKLECCIINCTLPARFNHLTCSLTEHLAWETARDQTVMSQMKRRLRRAGVVQANSGADGDELAPDANAPPKSTLKGRPSRRWTHNEQLFVRCCGIIVSRATFFGAEGVSGHKDFLKATFPPQFPKSLPQYIFYDNNCNFLKHLLHCNDHYFDNVGLPVDVFHAPGHNDDFCNTHNNPALFPQLMDEDGNWVFNSSAAEQANAWLGGFQSIVREMPESRYNFYLDEMIAIRNRETVVALKKDGKNPIFHSEAFLRGEE
ncbi:hypothetical protein B0H19DRAFT_1170950 [Mycena capillaripes]|nr:hypothetical protein B0H19DRAFT_1170950 [Mycena capillaripes]